MAKFTATRLNASYLMVTPLFCRLIRWNTVLTGVSTSRFRAEAIGLMMRLFPRDSWMYMPTASNSTAWWTAESTLRDWILKFPIYQAEVMGIYRAAQWKLANGVPFTRISIFSDSQAAIKSVLEVANNSMVIAAPTCLLDNSVSL